MRTSPTDPGLSTMNSRPDGRTPMVERAREEREERETMDDNAELDDRVRRAGSPTERELAGDPSERGGSWQEIKSRFVDDPEGAIAAAEKAVLVAMERAIRALKDEAAALCAPERDEDGASTEGRRTRLIRYQAFCERLASSATH